MVILERQQNSGLSIKDFCSNESYAVSSFHYWKSKFGLTRPYNTHAGDNVGKIVPLRRMKQYCCVGVNRTATSE